ncbi:hypothetical protein BD779DRAFT_1675710 [Infundibulicybe gibba]|nr:hypothetical protein BD779DRAFT_1675710 [Infundibulicybe gibba]
MENLPVPGMSPMMVALGLQLTGTPRFLNSFQSCSAKFAGSGAPSSSHIRPSGPRSTLNAAIAFSPRYTSSAPTSCARPPTPSLSSSKLKASIWISNGRTFNGTRLISTDPTTKVFPSFLSSGATIDSSERRLILGTDYAQLLQIKNKYDPDQLLDCWHCLTHSETM